MLIKHLEEFLVHINHIIFLSSCYHYCIIIIIINLSSVGKLRSQLFKKLQACGSSPCFICYQENLFSMDATLTFLIINNPRIFMVLSFPQKVSMFVTVLSLDSLSSICLFYVEGRINPLYSFDIMLRVSRIKFYIYLFTYLWLSQEGCQFKFYYLLTQN